MGSSPIDNPRTEGVVYIYTLSDPETGAIRYVGKTIDPVTRYSAHINPLNLRERTRKNAWVKSLLKRGLYPVMDVIERTTEEGWDSAERKAIITHKLAGCDLTNGTPGGAGFGRRAKRASRYPRNKQGPTYMKKYGS